VTLFASLSATRVSPFHPPGFYRNSTTPQSRPALPRVGR